MATKIDPKLKRSNSRICLMLALFPLKILTVHAVLQRSYTLKLCTRFVYLHAEDWPEVCWFFSPKLFFIRVILIGELRFQIFDIFSRNFSIFHIFLFFPPNIGMLTNLIFLVLEHFTNSDRTPPCIDTYLQLFLNFGNYGKKLSDRKWGV